MPTPTVDGIPAASALQVQLADIETAIDGLNAGSGVVSYLTVTTPQDPLPGVDTRCVFNPPLSDAGTISNTLSTLQTQQTNLIGQLEALGYSYTGSAIPSSVPTASPIPPPPPMPGSPNDPPAVPPAETPPDAPVPPTPIAP